MPRKSVPPSINETAFDCPHCGAFTTQYWFKVHADMLSKGSRTPTFPDEDARSNIKAAKELNDETRERFLKWIDKMETGLVFIDRNQKGAYIYDGAENLFLSQCYNCKKIAVWVHESLVFPPQKAGVQPNNDLTEEIIRDFEEARNILNLSPRGAAALLRLCIQKLCIALGEKGKNINDDIGSLVAKGLNPLVQKSLDVVRVIGNEAVHPGVIDLKDDRDTALRLFDLINLIADQMITNPKNIEKMYEKIPEAKKQAIEARNEKASRKD